MRYRFGDRVPEADGWGTDGPNILAASTLAAIRHVLESEGPVIVQHSLYRASSAPVWRVFESEGALRAYLNDECFAGDAIDVWSIAQQCTPAARIAAGKCPDADGRLPARGAY